MATTLGASKLILVTLAYKEGVDGRMVTKHKLSHTDGLPYFLTHGAKRTCLWRGCVEHSYYSEDQGI